MRKVLYKNWIPRQYMDNTPVEGTGCWDSDFIHEGVFLTWGVSSEEVTNGVATDTVGIIENNDGTVKTVYPFNLKFIDNQNE